MSTKYLDVDLMEKMCHRLAVAVFNTKNDPIAPFYDHNELLESALANPKHGFRGKEFYPSLSDKTAILYYSLNKNHPFKNGNKRISAASLVVFLFINDYWLHVSKKELFNRTLSIAKSNVVDKEFIISDTTRWIEKNIIPLSEIMIKPKK